MKISYSGLEAMSLPTANYNVTIRLSRLESFLSEEIQEIGLDLDPEYQRGLKWTEDQKVAYIEHLLTSNRISKTILIAHVRKSGDLHPGYYSLLDGKQRLNAMRSFVKGELRIFRHLFPEGVSWDDFSKEARLHPNATFEWSIIPLTKMSQVYRIYTSTNYGGTFHTPEEIERVREMMRDAEERGL